MSDTRPHHGLGTFSVFIIAGVFILMLVFLQAVGSAFIQLGFPPWLATIIIPGSLLGSVINIPIATVKSDATPCAESQFVNVYGLAYRVLTPDCPGKMQLSINVGGAIIPIAVSAYLLVTYQDVLVPAAIAIVIVTAFVHAVAKIEPNVGIVTPALLPPIVAALTTLTLIQFFPAPISATYAVAYVSGTLGALLGADILNLGKLNKLRTGRASIGGAGTWDGVFLTGILAMFFL